ncbi:GtrA family protein [Selenomonas sp. TAMA-11512]|uniref:GtrA family protein n=1 Tax=Selenomonas sp. TAMA-11512 TaxID=3095337 RepID=UPI0030CF89F2
MRIIDQIRRHFFTREFFLFLVIGCVNTFNGVLFSNLFTMLFPVNIAFVIGYILANLVAYVLCSRFLFHARLSVQRCVKFAVSYIPNFLIQNLIVFISYNLYALQPIIAFLLAAVLGVPITFLLVKLFAFGRR